MPASARVAAIVARLSAVGLPTRVEEYDRYTSVEAEIPEAPSADLWREALEVVAEADRFGLHATSQNGRTLWAVVHKAALRRAMSGDRAISDRS
ncbi:hypothetical protein K7864_07920 [Streptomyces sp. SP2-10]|nr:hypothetical protein [Streptomyces sp. SP2-10]